MLQYNNKNYIGILKKYNNYIFSCANFNYNYIDLSNYDECISIIAKYYFKGIYINFDEGYNLEYLKVINNICVKNNLFVVLAISEEVYYKNLNALSSHKSIKFVYFKDDITKNLNNNSNTFYINTFDKDFLSISHCDIFDNNFNFGAKYNILVFYNYEQLILSNYYYPYLINESKTAYSKFLKKLLASNTNKKIQLFNKNKIKDILYTYIYQKKSVYLTLESACKDIIYPLYFTRLKYAYFGTYNGIFFILNSDFEVNIYKDKIIFYLNKKINKFVFYPNINIKFNNNYINQLKKINNTYIIENNSFELYNIVPIRYQNYYIIRIPEVITNKIILSSNDKKFKLNVFANVEFNAFLNDDMLVKKEKSMHIMLVNENINNIKLIPCNTKSLKLKVYISTINAYNFELEYNNLFCLL